MWDLTITQSFLEGIIVCSTLSLLTIICEEYLWIAYKKLSARMTEYQKLVGSSDPIRKSSM